MSERLHPDATVRISRIGWIGGPNMSGNTASDLAGHMWQSMDSHRSEAIQPNMDLGKMKYPLVN